MCVCICVCMRLCMLSCVQLFVTPWMVASQAPLSIEFSRQEHLGGLPFPTPGDLPNPGIELMSLAPSALTGRFFTIMPTVKSLLEVTLIWILGCPSIP